MKNRNAKPLYRLLIVFLIFYCTFIGCICRPVQAQDGDSVHNAFITKLPGREAHFIETEFSGGAQKLPYTMHWDKYKIVVGRTKYGPNICIVDSHNKTLKRIIGSIVYIRIVRFGADRQKALWVQVSPTSNIAQNKRTYFFIAKPQLRTALIVKGWVDQIRNLNRSRKQLLITAHSPVMEWINGLGHAGTPGIAMILEYNRGKLRLANAHYPRIVKHIAMEYRSRIFDPDGYRPGDALGYYGNLYTIRRQKQALRWLELHLSRKDYDNFRTHLRQANSRIRQLEKMYYIDDQRYYNIVNS